VSVSFNRLLACVNSAWYICASVIEKKKIKGELVCLLIRGSKVSKRADKKSWKLSNLRESWFILGLGVET
jgi:hypothetical protein